MQQKTNVSLDSILESFTIDPTYVDLPKVKPITIWIPEEQKEKYDHIQALTKRKFARLLREVIVTSIDRVDLDTITAS